MKWLDGARTRLRLLFARQSAESRMNREFRFHIEMETEQLMRAKGLARDEARRRALAAFGGMEKYKEALRDGRGLAWLRGWSLDIKLGARMFARYPGVTTVSVAAMAIGIGLAAAYLEAVNDFLRPTLPLDEGERIVGLQNWDLAENAPELRSTADFLSWRDELKSVENIGAFREIERNIGLLNGVAEPARGVEITDVGLQGARVPALFGRALIAADDENGAPAVIVLGYQLWRDRFFGDSSVVGRTIQVGDSRSTVVGVMPEGFAFPVSHHFWVPLHPSVLANERRRGPPIQIFGRLAPGVSLEEAQAELSVVGVRASRDFRATHEHLRPRVMKYTELFVGSEGNWQAYLVQSVFVMLLAVLGSNVATMVFARTATREKEIAMRFALGASRGQILAQFFIEALVLALAATGVALAAVAWGARWFARFFWDVTQGAIPFWLDNRLNISTVLYAILLAVLVSLVAGVMPALKATGPRARARLRHSAGSGESALRFGGLWSAIIIAQVVFTVVILPPAIVSISALGEADHTDPGFAAEEYLSARVEMAMEPSRFVEFQATYEELRRRLLMKPQISRVTFASRLPGMGHPETWVDVERDESAPGATGELVTATSVDAGFFDAIGARMIAGRALNSVEPPNVVVVNEYFVNEVLQGRSAVGRRIRYTSRYGQRTATGQPQVLPRALMREPGVWYEIVGVVKNIGMDTTRDAFTTGKGPGVYHPLTRYAMRSGDSYSVRMAFHVREDAAAFAPQLRALAHAVHPALRVYDVLPLDGPVDRVSRSRRRIGRFFSSITALVAFVALLISVAGTYSVLSFTVSRQTREIGLRIALGADRRRIVSGVFSRAMIQIAIGIVVGAAIWFYAIVYLLGGGDRVDLLLATAVVLLLVGFIACGVPVRRALRIQPADALRNAG